mmetsp:Transcript_19635/g.41388  ORF Transcript_19635/g.41388 Transcript_19635/m.41388 type:complete len:544 (-) Transcript_19635:43-1674(-)
MFEQLTLGHSGIPHKTNVNISPNPHPIGKLARTTPHQLQQQRALNILVTENLGSNRAAQRAHRIVPVRNLLNPLVQLDPLLLAQVPVARLVVALFVHHYILRLQEGGGDESRLHGPVAALRHPLGQEHAVDRHHVPRRGQPRQFPATMHAHAPRHVAHGHLARKLLQLQFLKFDEFAPPRLQVQRVAALGLTAAFLVGTQPLRHEFAFRLHDLVDFAAARVARVGGHGARRLDVRGADDHSAKGHEMSHGAGADLTQGRSLDLGSGVQFADGGGVGRRRAVAILPVERREVARSTQGKDAELVPSHEERWQVFRGASSARCIVVPGQHRRVILEPPTAEGSVDILHSPIGRPRRLLCLPPRILLRPPLLQQHVNAIPRHTGSSIVVAPSSPTIVVRRHLHGIQNGIDHPAKQFLISHRIARSALRQVRPPHGIPRHEFAQRNLDQIRPTPILQSLHVVIRLAVFDALQMRHEARHATHERLPLGGRFEEQIVLVEIAVGGVVGGGLGEDGVFAEEEGEEGLVLVVFGVVGRGRGCGFVHGVSC